MRKGFFECQEQNQPTSPCEFVQWCHVPRRVALNQAYIVGAAPIGKFMGALKAFLPWILASSWSRPFWTEDLFQLNM